MGSVTIIEDALVVEDSSDPESKGAMSSTGAKFHLFNKLPGEIRDLVWEATLPPSRLFHVSSIAEKTVHHRMVAKDASPRGVFTFHIHHAPPLALRICHESRAVALRHGFFLSPGRHHVGVWFNPDIDVLYFDRNQRLLLRPRGGEPTISVPGWENVKHVGLEWRAFFRDIPRLAPGEDMRRYWRAAITPLYAYMPQMTTLHYILPMVRHKGGVTWGREPYGNSVYEADLVPLPGETHIPWETMRNATPSVAMAAVTNEFVRRAGGRTALLTTWDTIRNDIVRCFEEETDDEEEERGGSGRSSSDRDGPVDYDDWDDTVEKYFGYAKNTEKRDNYPPQIQGSWLLRPGAPDQVDNPQVGVFNY